MRIVTLMFTVPFRPLVATQMEIVQACCRYVFGPSDKRMWFLLRTVGVSLLLTAILFWAGQHFPAEMLLYKRTYTRLAAPHACFGLLSLVVALQLFRNMARAQSMTKFLALTGLTVFFGMFFEACALTVSWYMPGYRTLAGTWSFVLANMNFLPPPVLLPLRLTTLPSFFHVSVLACLLVVRLAYPPLLAVRTWVRSAAESEVELTTGRKLLFSSLVLCFGLSCVSVIYAGTVIVRTAGMLDLAAARSRTIEGVPHGAPDRDLGLAPLPSTQALQIIIYGDKRWEIPIINDIYDTRIPAGLVEREIHHPTFVAVGCSYTWGDGVLAEETYPHILAKRLGGTAWNAAVAGYGLAQMQLRLECLVPRLRPDYVLIQYSPWLITRSTEPVAQGGGRLVARPFYADKGGNTILHAATFIPRPNSAVRAFVGQDRPSLFTLLRIGLPLALSDDFALLRHKWTLLREDVTVAEPTPDVVHEVYEDIVRYVEACGSQAVIVYFDGWQHHRDEEIPVPHVAGALHVDAEGALRSGLQDPLDSNEYWDRYGQWRGGVFDGHPNPLMNRIIAETIADVILRSEIARPGQFSDAQPGTAARADD